MADGDPMVLQTRTEGDLSTDSNFLSLLQGGNFEYWSDTTAIADGWTYTPGAVTPIFTRQAGTRTSGDGTYYQSMSFASVSAGQEIGVIEQTIELLGNTGLDANGHLGRPFLAYMWIKGTGTGSATYDVQLSERNAAGAILASSNSTGNALITGSWGSHAINITLSQAATTNLRYTIVLDRTDTGTTVVVLDDSYLYTTYTFGRNPSIPDKQDTFVPRRSYGRSVNGLLRRFRPGGVDEKHRKTMRFGMINTAQYTAMRSLGLLDAPMKWTPNHPHLPATLDVRWVNNNNFAILRNLNVGMYHGTVVLEEV